PSFNQVFYNQITSFNEIQILGNPRLKPENTKAYDIGLVNAFPYGLKLDVSAYYKDVTNLIETAYYYDEQQSVYQTYRNRD
ncbi:MAG: TonB-dependent receptor, partial [Ignavibacteria bacterium]|nr:TonB-dependent receptor [Ignavibacteria bacterium]